jgi:hypothetical protein
MAKCSASGPSARTGKKVNAPMIRTVPASTPPKRRPSVRIVPTVIGTSFLAAIEPASASIKTIDTYRPRPITTAPLAFIQGVFAAIPAKADPLLAACEVYMYISSLKPCELGFEIALRSSEKANVAAMKNRINIGCIRNAAAASLTS